MTIQEFAVTGLRCEGCVDTVTDALSSLPTVSSVGVDLDPDGTSTVTVEAEPPVSRDAVQSLLGSKGNFAIVG
ncbi:heavy-metal-associated domain-containing protein [Mycolicibacterium komossense]|uniref:Heavy-metal-associated domain-containing protein n=1 Tax=Mycolicibacterium komossense TaxID=1779 RepID=A0ABT3CGD1_9MYCO|nr:heavy metal-associated domain-containing protein [Mycolicibacterium komossense]MCV7228476.1 heavy-metal-associated domain-containing protein [Mycolicibacterium komossense]